MLRGKIMQPTEKKRRTGRGLLLVLFAMSIVMGCSMVGPDFVQPRAPVETEWLASGDTRLRTESADYREWWTVFEDPVLSGLIESAYRQNLPLQIAGLRILEARALLGVATGNLYPQVQQGRGAFDYTRLSENTANTTAGFDQKYWEASTGFDAGWELDIWGKFRRAIESVEANLEASVADYDDALVSLTAEVARTYLVIRTIDERLAVARQNVQIQQRSLDIARVRFEAGAVTELDVQQAKSLLTNTQASIPGLEASLRQAQNALAILLGKLPGEVDGVLQDSGSIPAVPAEVVVAMPAELLRRRPDVRLAEYQLAVQSPLIGVAKADLYPSFELFGSIGLRSADSELTAAGSSDYSDLLEADSLEIFAGPSFRWNLFHYGRIKNRVRVEDARYQQLVVNYENTVLRAQQEVEDALVGFLKTQEQESFLLESVTAAKRSVELSMVQYREGLVDYQRVLDSQRILADQQDLQVATTGSVVTNLIAAYKSLGGGWQIRKGNGFVPSAMLEEMGRRTDWGDLLSPTAVQEPVPEEQRGRWRKPDW
jgi:NodT family efflux transporter outer membrane factor (OMF) lipoprotein